MPLQVLGTALSGMKMHQAGLAHSADRIAGWGTEADPAETVHLEQEMVAVLQSRRGYEANLAVVRAADDMLGSLIDFLA